MRRPRVRLSSLRLADSRGDPFTGSTGASKPCLRMMSHAELLCECRGPWPGGGLIGVSSATPDVIPSAMASDAGRSRLPKASSN